MCLSSRTGADGETDVVFTLMSVEDTEFPSVGLASSLSSTIQAELPGVEVGEIIRFGEYVVCKWRFFGHSLVAVVSLLFVVCVSVVCCLCLCCLLSCLCCLLSMSLLLVACVSAV